MKRAVYIDNCPYCNELVTFQYEDNRCSTDLGEMGREVYWCPKCDSDVTEDFEWTEELLS